MSAADARRAVEIGCAGIVISNHGGRQLDGSRAPFDQLAEIVDAVGDRIDVIWTAEFAAEPTLRRFPWAPRPLGSDDIISMLSPRPASPALNGRLA